MKGMDGMETQGRLRADKFHGFWSSSRYWKRWYFSLSRCRPTIIWSSRWKKNSLRKPWSVCLLPCKMPAKTACLCKRDMRDALSKGRDCFLWDHRPENISEPGIRRGSWLLWADWESGNEAGSHFFRCHRSYLINLKHLKGYKNGLHIWITAKRFPYHGCGARSFPVLFCSIWRICKRFLHMGAGNMAEYLDFLMYILWHDWDVFQFYFLAKILKKKYVPFLFPVCSMCSDCRNDFVPARMITGFVVLFFCSQHMGLLSAMQIFKYSLLYGSGSGNYADLWRNCKLYD